MQSKHMPLAMLAALLIAFTALPITGYAKGFKPVTSLKGRPPKTVLVEQPQEALKFWGREKVRHRTLLLISAGLGIMRADPAVVALVSGREGEDNWDGVLARPYPTLTKYSVQPSNYLHAAYRAGMIDKVYWVPPTKVSVGKERIEDFKGFLKGQYVSEADLEGLEQTGDSIKGTINGVPIYICNLKDLPEIKEEMVAAIDLSYFTSLYTNEVKTPMLDIVGWVFSALGAKGIHISNVVISRSTGLETVPLGFRFLGGYLFTYFTNPRYIEKGPPELWELRSQAMYLETFYQPEEMLEQYKKAVKIAPEDASVRYGLATTYLGLNDGDNLKVELDKAVSLDKGYYPAYIKFGSYFASKGYTEASRDFLNEAVKTNPDDPRGWDTLYDTCKASADFKGAALAMEKLIAMGYNSTENLGDLGEAYEKQGLHEKAAKAYQQALSQIPAVDRKARFSMLLGLASAYEGGRDIKTALKTYDEALAAADDPHTKQEIVDKMDDLWNKWAPFLGATGK